jgi:hypothetical protein
LSGLLGVWWTARTIRSDLLLSWQQTKRGSVVVLVNDTRNSVVYEAENPFPSQTFQDDVTLKVQLLFTFLKSLKAIG